MRLLNRSDSTKNQLPPPRVLTPDADRDVSEARAPILRCERLGGNAPHIDDVLTLRFLVLSKTIRKPQHQGWISRSSNSSLVHRGFHCKGEPLRDAT